MTCGPKFSLKSLLETGKLLVVKLEPRKRCWRRCGAVK
jgi:hypothetical protein